MKEKLRFLRKTSFRQIRFWFLVTPNPKDRYNHKLRYTGHTMRACYQQIIVSVGSRSSNRHRVLITNQRQRFELIQIHKCNCS